MESHVPNKAVKDKTEQQMQYWTILRIRRDHHTRRVGRSNIWNQGSRLEQHLCRKSEKRRRKRPMKEWKTFEIVILDRMTTVIDKQEEDDTL
jgi:hypothetical protein